MPKRVKRTKPSDSSPSRRDRDRPEWVEGYTFDAEAADRPCQFVETLCRVPSRDGGTPERMRLIDWQRDRVIRPLFGWKRPDGRLRYRRGCVFVPKKNGKSFLMAAVAQYLLCGHAPISDVYLAAVDRLQAREIYRVVAKFVASSPQLSKLLEVIDSKSVIRNRDHGNVLRCLSADAYRNEGLNGSVIIDEIHAHKNDQLISALTYATRATPNGLVLAISTAGDNRNSVGFQWWRDAELVLADPASNPSFLGLIYGADPEDPRGFGDPAVWREANPSMGTTFLEEEFAADYRDALTDPRKMSRWLRYSLNVWTERDNRWFHGDEFTRCQADPPEPLDGRPCWVGIDLADHDDLTAAVFLFRSPDGSFDAELLAWVPEEGMIEREKRDNVPYSSWVRDGWLRVTEGSRIDQERIYADIQEVLEGHECRGVFGDPWHLDWIATKLQADGVDVHKVRQTIGYLTGPSKMLEDLVKTRKLRYRSPIMSWASNNVCIWEDPNGSIRPDKSKSSEKVDPIFALINSLAGASTDAEPEGSDFTLHAL
jgi:phage terminase large subunit-like protein